MTITSFENTSVTTSELVLPSPNGVPWMDFPLSVVDAMRRMISRINRKGDIPARLSFVSALRQEGVSYIASAFATTLASDIETSVCLVDLNWWWPSELIAKFPINGGLGAVIKGETSLDHAIVKTGIPNLVILPAGNLATQERPYFARSTILKNIIQDLNARYEHLVLDAPAVLAANDAVPLASLGTASCMVIHQGATSFTEAKSVMTDLDHIPCLGVIMNRFSLAIPLSILRFLSPL